MKRFAVLIGLLSLCGPVRAEVSHRIQSNIQLSVDGASTTATRIGSSVSASGVNVKVGTGNNDTFAGLTAGSATAAATVVPGNFEINTAGQNFSFTNTAIQGDPISTLAAGVAVNATSGQAASLPAYGQVTSFAGGSKGSLGATLTSVGGGTLTISAGNSGTTSIGQFTSTLEINR